MEFLHSKSSKGTLIVLQYFQNMLASQEMITKFQQAFYCHSQVVHDDQV